MRIAGDYDFQLRLMQTPGIRLTYLPEVITRMSQGGVSTGSLRNLLLKSKEDLRALRNNGYRFPWLVLLAKILRKLPQLLRYTNYTNYYELHEILIVHFSLYVFNGVGFSNSGADRLGIPFSINIPTPPELLTTGP